MANTYTLIASNTLSTTAASVTFSAIPNTFTDLVLKVSSRNNDTGAAENLKIQLNNDTTTKYSFTYIIGSGTSAVPGRASNLAYVESRQDGAGATANAFSNLEIYIPSYTATQNKPFSSFAVTETNDAGNNYIYPIANLWRNTAAIDSIKLFNNGSFVFVSGSSFFLYGIKNS